MHDCKSITAIRLPAQDTFLNKCWPFNYILSKFPPMVSSLKKKKMPTIITLRGEGGGAAAGEILASLLAWSNIPNIFYEINLHPQPVLEFCETITFVLNLSLLYLFSTKGCRLRGFFYVLLSIISIKSWLSYYQIRIEILPAAIPMEKYNSH